MNKVKIAEALNNMKARMEAAGERSRRIDRGFDVNAGKISRRIWPVNENWLFAVAGAIMLGDFASTWFALEHNANIGEAGTLAGWALDAGGYPLLFLVDLASIGLIGLLALAARYLFRRNRYPGYGRAAFVFIFVPYIIRTSLVVINNVVLGLL
jgi:hypothetical protein